VIDYVAHGQSIRHAQLNALTAELDAVHRCIFSDKTPLIYDEISSGFTLGRIVAFGTSGSWKIIPILNGLGRGLPSSAYNHAVFTAAAAALVLDSSDATLQLAYSVTEPWTLDGSIEAHTTTISGDTYWWCQKTTNGLVGYRERYRRLEVLDVILEALGGALTWDSAWDKYHFLRFHNLDPSTNVITLPGGTTVTLPPFGIQSVRRSYPNINTYDTSHLYFWASVAGDSLFWDTGSPNNVGCLRGVHDRIYDVSFTIPGGVDPTLFFKPSIVWDGSSLLPQAIDDTLPLLKFKYHPGRIVAWDDAAGLAVQSDIVTTWTTLEAGVGGIKLDVAALEVQADTGTTAPVEAVGIGSNLLPVWPQTMPWDLNVGVGQISCLGVDVDSITLSLSSSYYVGLTLITVNDTQYASSISIFSHLGLDLSDSVADHGTLTSSAASELLAAPTVAWSSDGWRFIGSGTQSIPVSAEVVPSAFYIPYCDVTVDGFVQHFGADLLSRGSGTGTSYFKAFNRSYGRKLSPYVGVTDIFDLVYYEGHPDLSGTYGIAGGLDWEEARTENVQSALMRDDSYQSITGTVTGAVMPLADAADTIVANLSDPAWYPLNRGRLLANSTIVSERQNLQRLPILAEHYNSIAQILNSIMAIRPLTLDNVIYYGRGTSGLADGTWTAGAYPVDYYCAVAAVGSRAAELGVTRTFTGGGEHVTLASAKAWASGLGLRFFERRMTAVLKSLFGSFYNSRSSADIYRNAASDPMFIGRCVEGTTGGFYRTPPSAPGSPYTELLHIEWSQETGTIPSGWRIAGDDMIMAIPRRGINWDNDPLVSTDTYEPVSVYGKTSGGIATLIPAGTFDASIFSQGDLLTELGLSGDDREPWELRLVNRWLIVRA
jgi:hypothetical protein